MCCFRGTVEAAVLQGICISSQVQPGMKLGKDLQNIHVVLVVELLTGGAEILLPRDTCAKCALRRIKSGIRKVSPPLGCGIPRETKL